MTLQELIKKLTRVEVIAKLINKIGYIGIGMFLAAILEYGKNVYTVLGLMFAVCIVITTHIYKFEN